MSSQPAPWTIYREYVRPLHPYDWAHATQSFNPFKIRRRLVVGFLFRHHHRPGLISIVGSLVPTAAISGLDLGMSVTLTKEHSTFYSSWGIHLSASKVWMSVKSYHKERVLRAICTQKRLGGLGRMLAVQLPLLSKCPNCSAYRELS